MLNAKACGKAALLTTVLIGAGAFTLPGFTGGWSAPSNLQTMPGTGSGFSTPAVDGCASTSPDGLSIAFTSNRTGNFDVYFAHRANKSVGFGSPVRLPAPINTMSDDACPTLASNNRIFFSSDRDDPAYDLYVARPSDGGWSVTRFGPTINRPGWLEESAALFTAGGHEVMIFSSRRPTERQGRFTRASMARRLRSSRGACRATHPTTGQALRRTAGRFSSIPTAPARLGIRTSITRPESIRSDPSVRRFI